MRSRSYRQLWPNYAVFRKNRKKSLSLFLNADATLCFCSAESAGSLMVLSRSFDLMYCQHGRRWIPDLYLTHLDLRARALSTFAFTKSFVRRFVAMACSLTAEDQRSGFLVPGSAAKISIRGMMFCIHVLACQFLDKTFLNGDAVRGAAGPNTHLWLV